MKLTKPLFFLFSTLLAQAYQHSGVPSSSSDLHSGDQTSPKPSKPPDEWKTTTVIGSETVTVSCEKDVCHLPAVTCTVPQEEVPPQIHWKTTTIIYTKTVVFDCKETICECEPAFYTLPPSDFPTSKSEVTTAPNIPDTSSHNDTDTLPGTDSPVKTWSKVTVTGTSTITLSCDVTVCCYKTLTIKVPPESVPPFIDIPDSPSAEETAASPEQLHPTNWVTTTVINTKTVTLNCDYQTCTCPPFTFTIPKEEVPPEVTAPPNDNDESSHEWVTTTVIHSETVTLTCTYDVCVCETWTIIVPPEDVPPIVTPSPDDDKPPHKPGPPDEIPEKPLDHTKNTTHSITSEPLTWTTYIREGTREKTFTCIDTHCVWNHETTSFPVPDPNHSTYTWYTQFTHLGHVRTYECRDNTCVDDGIDTTTIPWSSVPSPNPTPDPDAPYYTLVIVDNKTLTLTCTGSEETSVCSSSDFTTSFIRTTITLPYPDLPTAWITTITQDDETLTLICLDTVCSNSEFTTTVAETGVPLLPVTGSVSTEGLEAKFVKRETKSDDAGVALEPFNLGIIFGTVLGSVMLLF